MEEESCLEARFAHSWATHVPSPISLCAIVAWAQVSAASNLPAEDLIPPFDKLGLLCLEMQSLQPRKLRPQRASTRELALAKMGKICAKRRTEHCNLLQWGACETDHMVCVLSSHLNNTDSISLISTSGHWQSLVPVNSPQVQSTVTSPLISTRYHSWF